MTIPCFNQFRNIEELQKQNSHLLAVVRQLSEEQELKEKNSVDERFASIISWNHFHLFHSLWGCPARVAAGKRRWSWFLFFRTAQLMMDLEAVKNQLEELTVTTSRQQTILDSVIRQRDMYKVLLTENGNVCFLLPRHGVFLFCRLPS